MEPEILSTHTAALFDYAVQRAAERLRAGQLVALPTETVYGLAANAWDDLAVRRIFEAKGRPAENPVIVHVAGVELARASVAEWPAVAAELAAAHWPGPLTMVLPRAERIPLSVTAGGPTVGVRWPSHPFIQAVIRACGFPLAAPSANRSNQLSPTNAEHVRKGLGRRAPLIIDGGQSQIGIESTVVDLTVSPPRILRPGMIELPGAQGHPGSKGHLRSPGLMPKHYAPRARLVLWEWKNEQELAAKAAAAAVARAKIHVIAHTHIPLHEKFGRVAVIPDDAEAYARALYAELHQCDETGAELIVVEALPPGEKWRGIADRLKRAS